MWSKNLCLFLIEKRSQTTLFINTPKQYLSTLLKKFYMIFGNKLFFIKVRNKNVCYSFRTMQYLFTQTQNRSCQSAVLGFCIIFVLAAKKKCNIVISHKKTMYKCTVGHEKHCKSSDVLRYYSNLYVQQFKVSD